MQTSNGTNAQVVSEPDLLSADEPRWLSVREIARDLSVSMHTAYKWSAKGKPWFPKTIRLHNGDLRVRRDWYEDWLKDLEAPGA